MFILRARNVKLPYIAQEKCRAWDGGGGERLKELDAKVDSSVVLVKRSKHINVINFFFFLRHFVRVMGEEWLSSLLQDLLIPCVLLAEALTPGVKLVLLDVLTTPYLAMPFFDDQVLGGSCSLVELGLV